MNSGFDMFQNSGYMRDRNRKKTLILDINDGSTETSLGTGGEFNIPLYEPLIIDKHSELYLDNFVTFNSVLADKPERAAFCLQINEFNLNTNCASNDSNQNIKDKIIIPNENRNIANLFLSVSHKAKKYNYLCDVNPMTISSLTGKITSLDGTPMFHGSDTTHVNTYEISGIGSSGWSKTDGTAQALTEGQTITSIQPASETAVGPLKVLTNTSLNAKSIFLTAPSSVVIDPDDYYDVTITIIAVDAEGGTPYTFTVGGANTGIQILKGTGRMTAELSIIARDK